MVTQNSTNRNMTGTVTYEVTMNKQPCFCATSSGHADVTGDGTSYQVVLSTERFDQNADFTVASGAFTAPVTGQYRFSTNIQWNVENASGVTEGQIIIRTSNADFNAVNTPTRERVTNYFGSNGYINHGGSCLAEMDAADTCIIIFAFYNGTKTTDTKTSFFSGQLAI